MSISGSDFIGPQARPPAAGLTIQEFITVVLRRWWLILLCVSLAAGVAYWYDQQQIEHYTAHAMLQRDRRGGGEGVGLSTYNSDPLDLGSEIQIMRGRAVIADAVDAAALRVRLEPARVLRAVIDVVKVAPDARSGTYLLVSDDQRFTLQSQSGRPLATASPGETLEAGGLSITIRAGARALEEPAQIVVLNRDAAIKDIQSGLMADNDWGATLIRVRYRDTDPGYAADAVNAVAAAYIKHDTRRAREQATRRAALVEQQLREVRDSLTIAREQMLNFQAQHGTVDPRDFSERLEKLEELQRTLRYQLNVLNSVAASLRTNGPIDDAFRRVLVEGSGFLPKGEELYAELKQYQSERQRLTAPRFGVTEAETRVQVLDSAILATRNEMLAITEQSARLRSQQLQDATQRIAALRGQLATVPEQNAVTAQLSQRVEAVQRTFDLLADKNYEAHITSESATGGAELVDPAVAPREPDPVRRGTLLLGIGAGLMIGIALAFLLETLDSTVRRLGDVERSTGLRVLALIPRGSSVRSKRKRRKSVGIMDDPRAAESFRLLRTALRFLTEKPHKILAITSARPKEGKSTVASNLAVAFAHQSDRVLVIDADLRRPTLHRVLGVSNTLGLSDVLNGNASLSAAIKRTSYNGLSVLTCGSAATNPAELLGGDAFERLLADCRERFDTVLIDTPPVLAVADAALVGSVVDGIILVARAGQTNRHALTHAAGEMHKFNVPALGVVLNAAPIYRSYGRYASYSGYYHFEAYNDYYMDTPIQESEKSTRRRLGSTAEEKRS